MTSGGFIYLPAILSRCVGRSGGCITSPTGAGWHELPGTTLRAVCAAEHGFEEVWGVEGCAGITADWSGGAYDSARNRLIIWGGGHNGYYGNELYALDLDDSALTRLNDPGLPIGDYTNCQEAVANGTQANSRHTYDGVEYIPTTDELFVFGGALACGIGTFGRDTWTFNFASMTWHRLQPSGPLPAAVPGIVTAFDPITGLIFLHDTMALYTFDPASKAYTQVSDATGIGYHLTATIDPVRRLFVIAGWDSTQQAGRVYTYDISDVTGGSARQIHELGTTGGATVIDQGYPGLAYDSVRARIVGWAGGDTAYSLDPDTGTWTPLAYSGGPGQQLQNGTMGRWQYASGSGAFVYYGSVDANGYLFNAP